MAIFAKIGDRRVNPLNVTDIESIVIKRRTVDETTSATQEIEKEAVSAVEIYLVGGRGIQIEGVSIDDVGNELDNALNSNLFDKSDGSLR